MCAASVGPLVPVLPVAGTHGFRGQPTAQWWRGGSPFLAHLDARGFYALNEYRPFLWTTGLNGARFWRRWFGIADHHVDWITGGYALYNYLRPLFDESDTYIPVANRNLIVHSHGLQVVLYACEAGLRINTLVSVMSPVRADMLAVAQRARPNIGHWEHLSTDRSDRWQWLGGVGDGKLGIERRHPLADVNTHVPKVGHTGLLEQPKHFPVWDETGILRRIRQRALR